MIQRSRNRLRCVGLLVIFWLAAFVPLNADPVGEIGSFSLFKEVDFSRLAKGEVLAERAPPMTFPRGLSAQFCFLAPKGLQETVELLKNFNPSQHPELNIYLFSNISSPAPNDFSKLKSAPNNEPVRAFARAMVKRQGSGLQMSAAEEKLLGNFADRGGAGVLSPDVCAFWSGILLRRATDFLAGGLSRQPPYADSIRASEEAAALLKEQEKIQARFAPLTAMLDEGGGNPALYWEMFDVEGKAALSLGASYWRRNGGGWQSMDAEYYCSGGYYVYLSFMELWPVKMGTQPATLVWRGDILSSATVGTLRGIERSIAANLLIKDVRRNTAALMKDTSR